MLESAEASCTEPHKESCWKPDPGLIWTEYSSWMTGTSQEGPGQTTWEAASISLTHRA